MKISKKIISFFLAVLMLLCLVPLNALESDNTNSSTTEEPPVALSASIQFSTRAVGDTFNDGNINYKVLTEIPRNYTVEVAVGTSTYTGNITIPDTVTYGSNAYTVTQIGDGAFGTAPT